MLLATIGIAGSAVACDDPERGGRPARTQVSVVAHGADPTGRTDSRAAIQRAIDKAGNSADVVFPPGRFVIGRAPREPLLAVGPTTVLRGAGRARTTLLLGSRIGPWDCLFGRAAQTDHVTEFVLEDLTVDANTRGNPVTRPPLAQGERRLIAYLAGGAAPRHQVRRCDFVDCSNVNTLYLAGRHVEIADCRFMDTGRARPDQGWDHSSIYATARVGGRITILRNSFTGVVGSAPARTAIETHGGDQVVAGNVVRDFYKGMNVTGIDPVSTPRIVISRNRIHGCGVGIQIWSRLHRDQVREPGAVLIEGNLMALDPARWVRRPGIGGATGCGVLISVPRGAARAGRVEVRHNELIFTTHQPAADGLVLAGGGEVEHLAITYNTLTDLTGAIAQLSGDVLSGVITDNRAAFSAAAHLARVAVAGGTISSTDVGRNTIGVPAASAIPHVKRAVTGPGRWVGGQDHPDRMVIGMPKGSRPY